MFLFLFDTRDRFNIHIESNNFIEIPYPGTRLKTRQEF
jgi:hypothetical protein